MGLQEASIIELDTIDSTNNYAMRLIDADTAQAGLTIVATRQTEGKGQRGRKWADVPGQSLLMSVITTPRQQLNEQFIFNATATVAIADVLQELYENWDVRIKWPNDIIINDKKAGGILIENILRGNRWLYAIIGLGLNIKQTEFPSDLPYATSLKIASGNDFDIVMLRDSLRNRILAYTSEITPAQAIMEQYNGYLYRKAKEQSFSNNTETWGAIILHVNNDGTLQVQEANGQLKAYTHGVEVWNWG
jgi:BirA family transcriptional regulator, biotin operon repressor / biotin---[acetyl-CoA-carboxylase] ligase